GVPQLQQAMARSLVVEKPLRSDRFCERRGVVLERGLLVPGMGVCAVGDLCVRRTHLWLQWIGAGSGDRECLGTTGGRWLLRRTDRWCAWANDPGSHRRFPG